MNNRKVAIIGAGISGLSAARILKSKGWEPHIFEKANIPGGLIRCSIEEGNLFHRVGGIVFNSHSESVRKWFWEQFDIKNEFVELKRNAKIWDGNNYTSYPVENHLYQLPLKIRIRSITEMLINGFRQEKADNFGDFLYNKFGKTLYAFYFHSYNTKIWNFDLKRIPLPWLNGKLPMPHPAEILWNNLFRRKEKKMVHSTFYYPLKGGSSFIADRLAEGLDIEYNHPVEKIEFTDTGWKINDVTFGSVIYTGDVRKLEKILQNLPEEIMKDTGEVTGLPANGTSNVLCYTDDNDLSWLYIPGREFKCHRIVYTGNLSPFNNRTDRKTCVVEFSGEVAEKTMHKEIRKLPGNLVPIAFNYEPDSYVIQLYNTREKVKSLRSKLRPMNFHLSGRFAEWEYHNMDMAILSTMKVCDQFKQS
jgi:protoporphyrinogen oxidase